jgi:hypothetical protein
MAAVLGVIGMSLCQAASACPEGELQFNFSNLKVREAFAIFANFSGLRQQVDPSVTESEPMKFGCTPWRVAAQQLADRHHLAMRIENGILYVTRK